MKNYLNILRSKISSWLGINNLAKEIEFQAFNNQALQEYHKELREIYPSVSKQCKKYKIINEETIIQIIKNKENELYLKYHNQINPNDFKLIMKAFIQD